MDIRELEGFDFLRACWGDEIVIALEDSIAEEKRMDNMDMKSFLSNCTACGGDWGAMLLSGIHELFPKTWEAIPDDMGIYVWRCLCEIIILCGIDTQ